MLELTFGEQVKIVLNRKRMTIKELAGLIEEKTGKKMSRQNLTQRLSRDNFQEQDMRMIAGILECPLQLSILGENVSVPQDVRQKETEKVSAAEASAAAEEAPVRERDITIGELLDIHERLDAIEEEETVRGNINESAPDMPEQLKSSSSVEELLAEVEALEAEGRKGRRSFISENEEKSRGWKSYLHRNRREEPSWEISEDEGGFEEIELADADEDMEVYQAGYEADEDLYIANGMYMDADEDTELGDVNPYTGKEYKTNSVRMHPDRIGYVQVYDRAEHRWTDMTEWAFLGYQERKKALLGNDYEPPIYLD